jgi:hypothetical protein
MCWHRPGRTFGRSCRRACRYCGVEVDWCPCVGLYYRSVDDECRACHGSMWVAVVRGNQAKIAELMLRD